MTLSVIGVGFGRTGTRSIKQALEYLDLGPCHHMEEVFKDPAQLSPWQAAVRGESIDWHIVFAKYKSTIDWPSTHYWRELIDVFPTAKVILSVRPEDAWWTSFSKTIKQLLEMRNNIPDEYVCSVLNMAHTMIAEQTFGGVMDKTSVLSAYQARIREVKQTVPAERLLILDPSEGWPPLCKFLNLPVPTVEFPHGNSANEFWQIFGGGYNPS